MAGHLWWHRLVHPALRRLKEEDCEFQASLSYIVRLCLENKKQKQNFVAHFYADAGSPGRRFLWLCRCV
jgi:hypothetical protein